MNREIDDEDTRWMLRAKCRGVRVDVFFPTKGINVCDDDESDGAVARAMCAECQVRIDCLAYACEHNIGYGIWGGLALRERRAYARQHRKGIT